MAVLQVGAEYIIKRRLLNVGRRRQTLPFKAFLVSMCESQHIALVRSHAECLSAAVFGLVIGADTALLAHEAERRRSENATRRQATRELSRNGIVPTETAIAKWRSERENNNN